MRMSMNQAPGLRAGVPERKMTKASSLLQKYTSADDQSTAPWNLGCTPLAQGDEFMIKRIAGAFAICLAIVGTGGCGKNSSSRTSRDGSPTVVGDILVGTQCPLGTMSNPIPGGFALAGCKIDSSEVQLKTPPGPILLSGDCAEKTIAIRSFDGSVDSLWQVPPDGSFSIVVPGFQGVFGLDGSRSAGCASGMTMEVTGRMSCTDRDVFSIRIDSMRLWMTPSTEAQRALFEAPDCRLPKSCRLESSMELRQCG
jgi:hypothetical protein